MTEYVFTTAHMSDGNIALSTENITGGWRMEEGAYIVLLPEELSVIS